MNLPFSTQLNGNPSYFPQKIWCGLIDNNIAKNFNEFYHKSDEMQTLGQTASLCLKPKLHTIRKDSSNRWKVGNNIHFYINARTKKQFQFAPVVKVKSIQEISIVWTGFCGGVWVYVDGKLLEDEQIKQLAENDGFDSAVDFFAYFNTDFKGKLIHWTDLKY